MQRAIRVFESSIGADSVEALSLEDDAADVALTIEVPMLLKWRAQGHSDNGVRCEEVVTVRFFPSYPWSAPRFYLREDFPRELPHIQPGPITRPPEPCLVDGNLDEFFMEAGLVGVLQQLHQWLERAAEGALINASQGWEPTLRHNLVDDLVLDRSWIEQVVCEQGGSRVYRTSFMQTGLVEAVDGRETMTFGRVDAERVRLQSPPSEGLFQGRLEDGKFLVGESLTLVIWAEPRGLPVIADKYQPETVYSMQALLERAEAYQMRVPLERELARLSSELARNELMTVTPVGVVMCVRRPYHLIGTDSTLELVPYYMDIGPQHCNSPLAEQPDIPVVPATHRDAVSQSLLERASGQSASGTFAMLGCGSLGSKIAMHLARGGNSVSVVSDYALFQPHNLARHGLYDGLSSGKATALAKALRRLGQPVVAHEANIVRWLGEATGVAALVPKGTTTVIDTTASRRVRDRLSSLPTEVSARMASGATFGNGYGGYLLIEGNDRSPTLDDLSTEYLRLGMEHPDLGSLQHAEDEGVRPMEVGQGCASMTIPMSDSRISAMASRLAETVVAEESSIPDTGRVIVRMDDETENEGQWIRQDIEAPIVVPITDGDGWTFRIPPRIEGAMRDEVSRWPSVETGGVLMGRTNERLKTITIVDLLDAPPDSVRSASGFRLGTSDLKNKISDYFERSGETLFDVGTWHSHLDDQGPSPTDRNTAISLAAERPPPYGMLIVTPSALHAIMHHPDLE